MECAFPPSLTTTPPLDPPQLQAKSMRRDRELQALRERTELAAAPYTRLEQAIQRLSHQNRVLLANKADLEELTQTLADDLAISLQHIEKLDSQNAALVEKNQKVRSFVDIACMGERPHLTLAMANMGKARLRLDQSSFCDFHFLWHGSWSTPRSRPPRMPPPTCR